MGAPTGEYDNSRARVARGIGMRGNMGARHIRARHRRDGGVPRVLAFASTRWLVERVCDSTPS